MSDKSEKPSRFTMIAAELAGDFEPTVIEAGPPALTWSDDSIQCPRCGLGAFEPVPVLGNEPMRVACLACDDRPTYPVFGGPPGLSTNRYRCGGCGKQSQVTMELSDVNLHCGGCGRLTLHARQSAPSTVLKTAFLKNQIGRVFASSTTRRGPSPRSKVITNDFDTPAVDTKTLALITRVIMSSLRLYDFDEYDELQRLENLKNGLVTMVRRTGRTWRGIVELMARCRATTSCPKVWVLGGTERIDDWLVSEVMKMRDQLGDKEPKTVSILKDSRTLRMLTPPPGVVLLVDHTYYERGR